MSLIGLRKFPSIPNFLNVYIIKDYRLISNTFSVSIEKIIYFFPLNDIVE